MTEKPPRDARTKKPVYHKPTVVRVPLRPEEAVLGTCKGAGDGPGGTACASVVSCLASGS